MKFQKGNKVATVNRGKPKTRTLEWELLGEAITTKHTKRFNEILDTLNDEKFLDRYMQVLEYFKPKLARSEHTGKDGDAIEVNLSNYTKTELENKTKDELLDVIAKPKL